MKANCWEGKRNIRVETVPDPKILNSRDAIVRITSTAICGSDLHLYNGFIPTMEKGDILGHEFMGEVVEVGRAGEEPQGRRPGGGAVPDRLRQLLRRASGTCTRSARTPTPTPGWPRSSGATPPPGIFGYSHMLGGYAGGQAEYARVPFADVGPIKVPDGTDRRAGALPLRHLPDRLHGRGDVRHQAGRRHRRLGRRPGRPVRHRQRLPARRRAGDRHRPLPVPACRWRGEGGRAPTASTTRRSDVLEALTGDDRRARARTRASTPSAWRRTATARSTPTTGPSRR